MVGISKKLFQKHARKYSGAGQWKPENVFFEILKGTVPSGDSFPTTHGNTIGLIILWNYIFYRAFGWNMLMEEIRVLEGGTYSLPCRINFCGDDTILVGRRVVLFYIKEHLIPAYFITDGQ